MNLVMKISLAAVFLMFPLSVASLAQQQEPTSAPEKKALIKELLELTGGRKTAEDVYNVMMNHMELQMKSVVASSVESDPTLSGDEKAEAEKLSSEVAARAFKQYKELFAQRIDFGQVMEDIGFSLYDKYYTEKELRDLIAFYKTETGRKTIVVMPALMGESMSKTEEAIRPVVEKIAKEVMESEMKRVKADMETKRKNRAPDQ